MIFRNLYLAGDGVCAGVCAGAGAVVCAGASLMELVAAAGFTVNDATMLSTQITIARVHVAFSMKSVVLR